MLINFMATIQFSRQGHNGHNRHHGHNGHHGHIGHHGHNGHHVHRKPKVKLGFYQAFIFWLLLIAMGFMAQHAYKKWAKPRAEPLDEGPRWSVNQYGPLEVWREQTEDLALACTSWVQEADTSAEHYRRTATILRKLEEGNGALIVLRAFERSENYPLWESKLNDLRRLVKTKPVPGTTVATEVEILINQLILGLFYLKREALYT
jgi:hypothetical protein